MSKGLIQIKLSDDSVYDLERILKDIRVLRLLVMDGGTIARRVTVKDNGTVILGKNKWEWVNLLFRENETINFMDLSMNLIQIFSNTVDGDVPEDKRARNIVKMATEWFNAALAENDWDQAVRLLFYCYYIGFRNPHELEEDKKKHGNNKGKGEVVGKINYVLLRTGLGLVAQDMEGNFWDLSRRR